MIPVKKISNVLADRTDPKVAFCSLLLLYSSTFLICFQNYLCSKHITLVALIQYLTTNRRCNICHAMRERRLCLWTASRSSPFRLDFEEAYFNISRSPEMLVPLSGGIALRYRSRAFARIQTGIVVVVVNLTGQRQAFPQNTFGTLPKGPSRPIRSLHAPQPGMFQRLNS